MLYGTTQYLYISVKLLAVFAVGLSCYMILRKILESFSIKKKKRRIRNIDSALRDFMNLPENRANDPLSKILLNTRLDELIHLLDQAKKHPDVSRRQLLYRSILGPDKLKELRKIAASGSSRRKRILAIKILGKCGSDEVARFIRNIIDRANDAEVIYAGIQALAETSTDISVEALISLLGTDKFSNSSIAAVLETLEYPVLNNSLERRNDPNSVVRFWVANLLGNYKNNAAFEALSDMLKDIDPNVRAAACESLGKIGDKKGVDLLHSMLDDSYWFVRLHAIKSLGQLGSMESINKIAPSLRDRNWWVRYNAKSALKRFGLGVTPYMYPILRDEDRFARNSAAEILEETGGADLVFDKIIAHNISDEKTYGYFIDFIKAEGFLWLKSRLKKVDSEKRQTVLKLIEKEDRNIYVETLEKEFAAGNPRGEDVVAR